MRTRRLPILLFSLLLVLAGIATFALHAKPASADSQGSFVAVADSTVDSKHPDRVSPVGTWLGLDAQPPRDVFFSFDVTIPDGQVVTSAIFQCWAGSQNDSGASLWETSNDWTEDTITWNNAPMPDFTEPPVGQLTDVDGGSYVTTDVTAAIDGSGTYSFVAATESAIRWSCASRYSNHPPQLLVSTAPAPSPSSSEPTPPAPTSTAPPTSTPPTTTPPSTSTPPSSPPPSSPPPPSPGHKLLVIIGENHSDQEALAHMPHLAAWAQTFGQATNYSAIRHPSLPNYLAIWGGSTFGVTTDCGVGTSGCTPSAPSVFGQTLAAGKTATAYQESMSSACQTSGSGSYAPRHGPWPYWQDSTERAYCKSNDVPSGTVTSGNLHDDIANGTLPVTGEVTPNLCNDAHDCGLSTFDTWLARWVPAIMAGPDYRSGKLTIIITFDEDDGSQGNDVALVAIDPRLSGKTVTGSYNHYSLTKWLDDNAGVPELRNAAGAPDLRAAFGL
jgi:phosphatidylinositol-3-phosphatase